MKRRKKKGKRDTGAAPLTGGATISQWELKSPSFPGSHVSTCYISVSPPPPSVPPRPLASHSTPDKEQGGSASPSLFISRLPASQSLPCNPSFTLCLGVCVWLSTTHSNSGYVTQKTMQKAYFILCLQGFMDFLLLLLFPLISYSSSSRRGVHNK